MLLQNGADIPTEPAPIPLSAAARIYLDFKTDQKLGRSQVSAGRDSNGDNLSALPQGLPNSTGTANHAAAAAIAIANGTKYGLVAGVWTRDGGRQMRMARALKCGQVFINNYGAGGGIELPFGGVKHSGHGREKGFEALYGFSTLKTVAIQHG